MNVEIISVGTEIVTGNTVDTNAGYLARKLTEAGFEVHYISAVGDSKRRLTATIRRARERAAVVIITGGLGPTEDDITRQGLAGALGRDLVQSRELKQSLEQYFAVRDYTLTENNYRQTYLPEGAQPVKNEWGTAPGILIREEDVTIMALPGVPSEMKKMFTGRILPELKKMKQGSTGTKILHLFGIGESSLEPKLAGLLNNDISLLAKRGEVNIRITGRGNNEREARASIDRKERQIRERVGDYIYGVDEENLPSVVGGLLTNRGATLSVAESCTGGLIGSRITDIAGSSDYFRGGMIVYSNRAKTDLLGVKQITLKNHGAVSRETVTEMAAKVRERFNSDYSIAVSGIAGPGGGSKQKPVGLVYIGLGNKNGVDLFNLNLSGDRDWNKWMSSQYALFYLYKNLLRERGN